MGWETKKIRDALVATFCDDSEKNSEFRIGPFSLKGAQSFFCTERIFSLPFVPYVPSDKKRPMAFFSPFRGREDEIIASLSSLFALQDGIFPRVAHTCE